MIWASASSHWSWHSLRLVQLDGLVEALHSLGELLLVKQQFTAIDLAQFPPVTPPTTTHDSFLLCPLPRRDMIWTRILLTSSCWALPDRGTASGSS